MQINRRLTLLILLNLTVALAAVVTGRAQNDYEIREKFVSEDYSVSWKKVRQFAKDAELKIGYGSGHGRTLAWVWFRPSETGVNVLLIELDEGWRPYKSKWGPDSVPVKVQRGTVTSDQYAVLLRQLAIVDSAKLSRIDRGSMRMTSGDFWVSVDMFKTGTKFLSWDWAGYTGSLHVTEYAQPKVAVELVKTTLSKMDLREHTLNDEERGLVSSHFAEDWNKHKARDFYWWIQERSIMIAGGLGDKECLSTLIEIMSSKITGGPEDRLVYYAINAIT